VQKNSVSIEGSHNGVGMFQFHVKMIRKGFLKLLARSQILDFGQKFAALVLGHEKLAALG
jgi:hypothetical protein